MDFLQKEIPELFKNEKHGKFSKITGIDNNIRRRLS